MGQRRGLWIHEMQNIIIYSVHVHYVCMPYALASYEFAYKPLIYRMFLACRCSILTWININVLINIMRDRQFLRHCSRHSRQSRRMYIFATRKVHYSDSWIGWLIAVSHALFVPVLQNNWYYSVTCSLYNKSIFILQENTPMKI